jgi:hypothetical protein
VKFFADLEEARRWLLGKDNHCAIRERILAGAAEIKLAGLLKSSFIRPSLPSLDGPIWRVSTWSLQEFCCACGWPDFFLVVRPAC